MRGTNLDLLDMLYCGCWPILSVFDASLLRVLEHTTYFMRWIFWVLVLAAPFERSVVCFELRCFLSLPIGLGRRASWLTYLLQQLPCLRHVQLSLIIRYDCVTLVRVFWIFCLFFLFLVIDTQANTCRMTNI